MNSQVTMALLRYLQPIVSLTYPKGPLSSELPSAHFTRAHFLVTVQQLSHKQSSVCTTAVLLLSRHVLVNTASTHTQPFLVLCDHVFKFAMSIIRGVKSPWVA